MKDKIKVFFIIPNLNPGGAERVMSFIPQYLDKDKFDATLVVIGFEKNAKYKISGVKVEYLNKKRVLHSIIALIRILKKQKPQVVISAISHLNAAMGLISILFPNIKFIGRHTIVTIADEKFKIENRKSFKKRIGQKMRKPLGIGFKYLDIILCQSMDMYNDMKLKLDVPEERLKIISNPITDNFELKAKNIDSDEVVKFITVARISKNKGHKRILNAIAKLTYPFHYTIIGDGVNIKNVLKQIKKLGLQDKIEYIPYTTEVSKYLANSDYFLMGSYSEGLPNSLIESCAVGTPVIAYRAPGGLNEVIEDGVTGFLVDNEAEFIEKLNEKRDWDPKTIRESVYKKFNKDKIIGDYEKLIIEVLN